MYIHWNITQQVSNVQKVEFTIDSMYIGWEKCPSTKVPILVQTCIYRTINMTFNVTNHLIHVSLDSTDDMKVSSSPQRVCAKCNILRFLAAMMDP